MGSRVKKYRMKPIPSAFSEKGGFNAQFVGDGYSIDARTEILHDVIRANGIQIGEGTAWDLLTAFLKTCVQRVANTGETVNVGSLLSFGLAIKGWYEHKDSKADKDNVRVSATLLGDLKPSVAFSMSNALEGATLTLYTVMSDGCGLGHVVQGAAFRINGKELKMLEGDTVTAELKAADGTKVSAACEIVDSDDDHIDAVLPAAFSGEECVGRPITFRVTGRCGDPEAGQQSKTIDATLDAAATPPAPTGPTLTGVHAPGIEPPMIHLESGIWFDGTGLDGWTGGEGDEILAKNNRAEEAEWTRVDLHEDVGGEVVFDGGMLKMDEGVWTILDNLGIVEGSEVRFKVTVGGNSAEIVATVSEA